MEFISVLLLGIICVNCVFCLESNFLTKKEIKFCRSNDDCEDGCCKGFVCLKYLQEDEMCLLEDRLRIGCGCLPNLECKKQPILWRCTNPVNEDTRDVNDMIVDKGVTRKESDILKDDMERSIDKVLNYLSNKVEESK